MASTLLLKRISRRTALTGAAFLGALGSIGAGAMRDAGAQHASSQAHAGHGEHYSGGNRVIGEVDHARNGFDPHDMISDFDLGEVVSDPDGRQVRECTITAADREVEIAPGVFFPA